MKNKILIFGTVPHLRLFSIDVLRGGEPAGRRRLLGRSMLKWGMTAICIVVFSLFLALLYALATGQSMEVVFNENNPTLILLAALGMIGPLAIFLTVAAIWPCCSLHDRLAGVRLAPK